MEYYWYALLARLKLLLCVTYNISPYSMASDSVMLCVVPGLEYFVYR